MKSSNAFNSNNYSKPKDSKLNEGSENSTSHENERQDRDSSNGEDSKWSSRNNNNNRGRGGRGRGRGRGGDRGNRGRGRNFNSNNDNDNDNNNHEEDDNVEVPDNAIEELFVKGINFEANEDDLRETFNKYGTISSCKILKDKETDKSKGCGFVKFTDKKSAVRALNDADNLVCKGRNLLVRFANDKEGELKGKKKGPSGNRDSKGFGEKNNNSDEDDNKRNGSGRGRGRGRGGDRGGRGGRGGFRGGNDRGRGRGGRGKGHDQNNDNNSRGKFNNSNNEENNSDQGWGSFNNRERSRSKEKDNEW